MAQPPILPRWQGQAWPVKRTPITSTKVTRHVSGREVRAPNFINPLYQFEISFEGLASGTSFPGLSERSLHELQGFYLACGGTLTPFLFVDQSDNTARGQVLGVGDGVTTVWPFLRAVGSRFVEPVSWVTNVAAIYVGGQVGGNALPVQDYGRASDPVTASADYGPASETIATVADYGLASDGPPAFSWTLAQPASLVLTPAAPVGAVILADFAYAFLCRFSDDTVEFDNIMEGIWQNDSLRFQTFR